MKVIPVDLSAALYWLDDRYEWLWWCTLGEEWHFSSSSPIHGSCRLSAIPLIPLDSGFWSHRSPRCQLASINAAALGL